MVISAIRPRFHRLLFAGLVFFAGGLVLPASARPADAADPLIRAMEAELRSLADSSQMPPAARESRVASVVRVAVVRTTRGLTESPAILAAASRVAETAIQAAPADEEIILNAVSLAPVVALIEGGARQVRETVRNDGPPPDAPTLETARRDHAPAVRPAVKHQASGGSVRPTERRMAREETRANVNRSAKSEDTPYAGDPELRFSLGALGENTGLHFTADVSVARDSNVFLSESNEVADTIISVSPGLSFLFGRAAATGGSFSYQQTFVNYTGQSVPNVSLGSGSLQLGYDNGRTRLNGNMIFRQLNQNDRDPAGTSGANGERIFRRDLFDVSAGTEFGLGSKLRFGTSAGLSSTDYRRDDLIDNHQIEIPLRLFLPLTPKTSLSVGTSFRNVTAQAEDADSRSRDFFHNIGIRGALAPKLSGEFSIGYRTRKVDQQEGDSLLGFDGSLTLALMTRSSLSLRLARDFNISAQGETQESDRYTLRFATNPTDQWSLGTTLSYSSSDYGPSFFDVLNVPTTIQRTDRFWEGSLMTSYAFTRWFSASADYSLRGNDSNLPTAEYANNVLKLNMQFRY